MAGDLDLGVVLGLTGIGVGGLSLLYVRVQARAAHAQAQATRLQAERATQLNEMAANQAVVARFHDLRNRIGSNERIQRELREATPAIGRVFDDVGGYESYITLREGTELFQDAYFLRAGGILSDAYWGDCVANFRIWGRLPSFRTVFEFAAERQLLHPRFVEFFHPVFDGKPLSDPLSNDAASR